MAVVASPPLVAEDLLALVRARWSNPTAGPAKVGVEQEWHTYPLDEPCRRCTPAEVLAAVPALPGGARVTVEPGGQVELATAPTAPWWVAADRLTADAAVLRAALHGAGIGTLGCGVDPFRAARRTLHEPRYDAMERYLDRWGPAGRGMMCATAAIQTNVDLGEGDEPVHRWRAAHVVGPALAATFAASPGPAARSERLVTWARLDPSRTRSAYATGDPSVDWARYLGSARVLLVRDDDRCTVPDLPLTFEEWVASAHPAGRPATADDLDYHATTVFPPVRLRGWLELRWLDSLPGPWAEVAVAASVALVVDPVARAAAEAACAPVATAWDRARRHGPRDLELARAAGACLEAAAGSLRCHGAPEQAEAVEEYADRFPRRGRCPADDLEALLAGGAGPDRVLELWR